MFNISKATWEKISYVFTVVAVIVSIFDLYQYYRIENKSNKIQEQQLMLEENITVLQNKIYEITNFNTSIYARAYVF